MKTSVYSRGTLCQALKNDTYYPTNRFRSCLNRSDLILAGIGSACALASKKLDPTRFETKVGKLDKGGTDL